MTTKGGASSLAHAAYELRQVKSNLTVVANSLLISAKPVAKLMTIHNNYAHASKNNAIIHMERR